MLNREQKEKAKEILKKSENRKETEGTEQNQTIEGNDYSVEKWKTNNETNS